MSEYCNNFEFKEDNSDSFQFWQGLRGPYFTPSVDEAGNLSWTNNGGLPNPETVNIKGQNGEDIHIGGIVETVEELPETADDNVVWLVGSDAPYEAYIYVNGEWVDAGQFLPGGGGGVQSDWNETNPANPAFIKNKPTIPAAQIQSDWNQTTTTAKDYIKNKPTVPAVDDTLSNTGEAADAKKTGDEISDLRNTTINELVNGNAFDVLGFIDKFDWSMREVDYTWNADKTAVTVSGTATGGNSVLSLIEGSSGMPKWLVPGKKYRLKYSAANVYLQVLSYKNGVIASELLKTKTDGEFAIPSDATGIVIRLFVESGTNVGTPGETLSPVLFTEVLTNAELGMLNTSVETEMYEYASSDSGEATASFLNRINSVSEWTLNTYIDYNDGEVKPVTQAGSYASTSKNMIAVPKGMRIHIHGPNRIAKYNADGSFISSSDTTSLDTIISSDEASYVRVQYLSIDPSVLGFCVAYRYSAIEEYESLEYKIEHGNDGVNNKYETMTDKTGNPLVLNDCDNRKPFDKFSVSGNATGEKIVICKKNIFAIRHTNGTFEKNNLYFTFNTVLNTIHIRSKTDAGASALSTSGFATFDSEFQSVNNIPLYHNFKFKFPVNTIVSVSDNASKETPFDFPIQMRITDGTNHYEVGTGGVTFLAEAGTEYAALFIVKQGWAGDITYSPQIEINTYPTAFEVYEGIRTTLLSTGSENIFECGGTDPGRYTQLNGKIKTLFDCGTNEVVIDATNDTNSDVLIYDTTKTPTVNGVTAYYLFKFTPSTGPVFVRSYGDQYTGKIGAQITDGTNTLYDYLGNGIFFEADGSTEYAYRFVIRAGVSVNMVLKPVISTGIYALKDFGTYSKKTVLYTDGGASLTVREKRITTKSKSINNLTYTKALETVTGGHILTPFLKLLSRGPIVSFVDDDTWNMTYVERYHDIFAAKNALGGYAVITENMRTDPNTMQPADPDLLPTLLEYEKEGFAMLYHCHDQNGVNTRYWIYGDPSYDEDLIRENFVTGLRDMADFGFSNYKYWVTPYGVNQKFIVDLAKGYGLQCIMNCPSSNYYQEGFTTPYGNVSRWNIPRVIFGDYSNNDDMLHRVLQSAKAANGWAIIVSHVNSWGSNVSGMTTRLSNLIQYCKDEGFEIVPFPVGFEEYRAAFLMNELF